MLLCVHEYDHLPYGDVQVNAIHSLSNTGGHVCRTDFYLQMTLYPVAIVIWYCGVWQARAIYQLSILLENDVWYITVVCFWLIKSNIIVNFT